MLLCDKNIKTVLLPGFSLPSSSVLELIVYPAVYEIWKWKFEVKLAQESTSA